ncbi:hypothetical protein [Rickettsia tamurae]|nr:hypothetical protein [Rickettsia tamurae]
MKKLSHSNNLSILNWIPRSSRGMTLEKLTHATMLARNNDIYLYLAMQK